MENLSGILREILTDPEHEGYSPYLYLDTKGNLTVGIGHNFGAINKDNTLSELKKMYVYKDGKELTGAEIEACYKEFKSFYLNHKNTNGNINYKEKYYKNKFGFYVNTDDVILKLDKDIQTAIKDASQVFSGSFSFASNKQKAGLAIMAFAMGKPRLIVFAEQSTKFKSLFGEKKYKEAGKLIDKISAWPIKRRIFVKRMIENIYL